MDRVGHTRDVVQGLSVGDAFGETFLRDGDDYLQRLTRRRVAAPPWAYTDDTLMALSIVENLRRHNGIEPDTLAHSFALRYEAQRGYGAAMHGLLAVVREGQDWRLCAPALFNGLGSFGNGSAMRVAPIGAWFADDLEAVREHARVSSLVTHAHAQAQAGAIGVAMATAHAVRARAAGTRPDPEAFLECVMEGTPAGTVREGLHRAMVLGFKPDSMEAAQILGSGARVTAADTVPFTVWCAARWLDDYEEALWQTARGLGDVDTTCAIVGAIVSAYTGSEAIPQIWLSAREALPLWPFAE